MGRRLALAALALAPVLGVGTAGPARGGAGERIRSFAVELEIRADGALRVTEDISYDFGTNRRHGIVRDIPTRARHDDRHDRVVRLDVLEVSAPAGTPDGFREEGVEGGTRIRIGDRDRTISGLHRYRIAYLVRGVLNGFEEHDELFWNAVGQGWDVPVDRVSVRVRAPARIDGASCFAGPRGSRLSCAEARSDGPTAGFAHGRLGPHQALTVVVGLPKGAVPPPRPILEERWSAAHAFSVTPATVAGSAGLLALAGAGLGWLIWRRGRDRRYLGSPVDAVFGSARGTEERVPLLDRPETPVEYEPPDGLRPGELGTLFDERANPLDVTATIVDLAVRGFLRIEEIPKQGWRGKVDWRLVRLREPEGLLAYEQRLMASLFASDGEVRLSELKTHFSDELAKVQDALYDLVVERGWFLRRPDRVRRWWRFLGGVLLLVGVALTVLLAAFTSAGLLGLPVVLAGLALTVLGGRMPHRTAKGTGVLRRVQGFRRLIDESEAERARFAERAHLFSEYLPYAVVFGATEKWAKAFAGLDREAVATGWYVSPDPFPFADFGDRVDGFTTTAAGTIVAAAPSSSGFSGGSAGGGFGGGGGGSW